MIDNSDIETYIYLSRKSFSIVVLGTDGSEIIYQDNFLAQKSNDEIVITDLEKFLEKNILTIEKQINNFINHF